MQRREFLIMLSAAPLTIALARFGWDACAARQDELYAALLSRRA